jgi:hypothetical protein
MSDIGAPPCVLIGLVGYTPVLQSYPLGPALMARLQAESWPGASATIENMSWGPVAIVQSMQASDTRYDRAVLIGAVQRGRAPGSVMAGHWQGGTLEPQLMQERMFEAVTGIVSLDNLLVIGEHFTVWPPELITVEVELPKTCFGDLVIAEYGSSPMDHDENIEASLGFRPSAVIDALVVLARRALLEGAAGGMALEPRTAATLMPTEEFWQSQIAGAQPMSASPRRNAP